MLTQRVSNIVVGTYVGTGGRHGTQYGLARVTELAAHLSAVASRVEKARYADIEKDDFRRVITEYVGGQGAREAKKKLKIGTLKDLVRSFRTSISVTKLCDADRAVREYLLYVVLAACWRA